MKQLPIPGVPGKPPGPTLEDFAKASADHHHQMSAELQQKAEPEPWQRVPGVATDAEGGKYWRGRQLPMFLSAHEVYHHANMLDQYQPDRRKLMTAKYEEASQTAKQVQPDPENPGNSREVIVPSLLDHLRGKQFDNMRPLTVSYDPNVRRYGNENITLRDGHHHLAAALAEIPHTPLAVQAGETQYNLDSVRVGDYQDHASFDHLPANPTGYTAE